jgi:pyridoxal phosphate enzyme (YggS family)
MTTPEHRRAELQRNLAEVRARLQQACESAGRRPDELTLVAVTKFFPASDAVTLCELGLTDLGESRDQEAAAKVAEFTTLSDLQPRWHFVGRLQRNKARSVAGYADVVHSLDRAELIRPLDEGVQRAGRSRLDVLVQVSLDGDVARGGVLMTEVASFADRVAESSALLLAGVMAIAPIAADPDDAFARLASVSAELRAAHPDATVVSAGMSADLEAAVRHGATHVRIGTALLGRRATNFG